MISSNLNRDQIAMIKICTPQMACRVIDRAIQLYGVNYFLYQGCPSICREFHQFCLGIYA
jgi:hypothetical protein